MTRVLLAEKEKSGEILDFFFAKFRPQSKGRMKGGENLRAQTRRSGRRGFRERTLSSLRFHGNQ